MYGDSGRYNKLKSMVQDGSSEPCNVTLEYLRNITNNFSDERILGEGGFGTVYKGVLPNGEMIAVKKLNSSIPGVKDKHFENEAYHLMRFKHPNIVLLVGWCSETENIYVQYKGKYICAEKSERLLCLEYMPKGSLRGYLSNEASGFGWETRYKIIEGICYGLHYLHDEWQPGAPIIHMDLKPANILLDNNMVPKIADFGLSRLFSEEKTWTHTINRDGTLGYMAPEYINRGVISTKSDIFSLGVIIIEVVTGHREYPDDGVSPENFTELVLKNWRNRLQKTVGYKEELYYRQIRRCIHIGLVCVELDRSKRPTTSQIIKMLHADSADSSVRKKVRPLINAGAIHDHDSPELPLAALRAATGGFSPSNRIGSGVFGSLYRASLADGCEVAIKRAERRGRYPGAASSSFMAAVSELSLISRVNHKNLVRLLGFSADGGVFGSTVYRASLADGRKVAIKRAERRSRYPRAASSSFMEAVSELALLSRVNHRNLVRLLGFCADGGERILVYEYMPNGTLQDHLHRAPSAEPLSPPLASWPARLRLALGAARGIEHMHIYDVPPIIHCDIKSSNILLDANWTAKVSDVGLSLLNDLSSSEAVTVGYMDPEYYQLQRLTDKSDVYSFGVVLLELLSGCKVIQQFEGSSTPKNVIDVTVPQIKADHVRRVLDGRLPLPTPRVMEAVAYVGNLAADCVRPAGRDRPTMSEVVGMLELAVAACKEENDDRGDGGSTTT